MVVVELLAEPAVRNEQHSNEVEDHCDRQGEGVVGIIGEAERGEQACEAGEDGEGAAAGAQRLDPEPLPGRGDP